MPLDLPRLVMRRASVVAVAFLLMLLVLGAIAARSDTRDEIAGALGDAASTEQTVSWRVERGARGPWAATLVASPESEQHEALSNLLGLFLLVAASSVVMLAAIARIERQDPAGVQALPTMPIRELETMAGALKRLACNRWRAAPAGRRARAAWPRCWTPWQPAGRAPVPTGFVARRT